MRIHSYDDELITSGTLPYINGAGWCWYKMNDGVYDTSQVDVTVIDAACEATKGQPGLFLADIEAWNPVGEDGIANIRKALMRWRTNQPDREIGLYGIIPIRNYWTPVSIVEYLKIGNNEALNSKRADVEAWKKASAENAHAFLSLVDYICPSVYCFYPDHDDHWRVYAEANINLAHELANGKPVRPILMPTMPNTTTEIKPSTWDMMVDFVVKHPLVDSLMIHTWHTYVCNIDWRKKLKGMNISLWIT